MTHISISHLSTSGNRYKKIDDSYIQKRDKILFLIHSYNNLTDSDEAKLDIAQKLESKISYFKTWYFCMPSARDRCKVTPVSYTSSAGFSSGSAPFALVSGSTSSYKNTLHDELKSAEIQLKADIKNLKNLSSAQSKENNQSSKNHEID
jgi:hypothetical protein